MTEELEIDELYEQTRIVRQGIISSESRKIYFGIQQRYLVFLFRKKPDLITDAFKEHVLYDWEQDELPNDVLLRARIKEVMQNQPDIEPIKFQEMTAQDLIIFVMDVRSKAPNQSISYSTANNFRTAFFNLFRQCGHIMSKPLETEIANHYRGLKRAITRDTTEGRRTAKVGKDPLPFDVYRFIGKTSLSLKGREYVFARTFMIMTWNLMCRASNTVHIKFGHMEWKIQWTRDHDSPHPNHSN